MNVIISVAKPARKIMKLEYRHRSDIFRENYKMFE